MIEMTLAELTLEFLVDLSRCEPWGPGNNTPHILLKDCLVSDARAMGNRRQWMRVRIQQHGTRISARIAALLLRHDVTPENPVDIVCEARIREWQGMPDIGLTIQSMKLCNPIQSSLLPVAV
jgi:single-stranded DNA-specific DHH superfamily exonuclease